MRIAKIDMKTIDKTVMVTNSIEGYKPASKSVRTRVKSTMERYNVKVSSKR